MSYDTVKIEKGNNTYNTGYNMGWGSNTIPDGASEPIYNPDDEFSANAIIVGKGLFGGVVTFDPRKSEFREYDADAVEPWEGVTLSEDEILQHPLTERMLKVKALFADHDPTWRELGEIVG